MPGADINKIGDYTLDEIGRMTPDQLEAARSLNFLRPGPDPADVTARPAYAGVSVGNPGAVAVAFDQAPHEPKMTGGWKRRGEKAGYDFTTPSGQQCRIRPLQPEELLLEGLLEQVTRLDGLAQELVNLSSGLPPQEQRMPSREDLASLLTVLNKVTILAVVEPRVFPDGDSDAGDTDVYVSDIELGDRIAILNESLKGVKALDNFRQS